MKYFAVSCVRGHQGIGNYDSTITFYFKAKDALAAMKKGQKMPGVKHRLIPNVKEISEEEFLLHNESAYIPFYK